MSPEERRRAERHEYDCLVLIAHGPDGFVGHIDNVSATGCRTTRPHDWALANGAEVRLYLMIDERYVFSAEARVVWASNEYLGFEYLEPQPLPA
ncbi:MAG: PilZ domain-containing protein [Lysobacter sp.]|nr:PilZ domain-containing protein [Lysobacter sp.]